MVKEFLTLHIGQAGVQSSHALWELTCMEHGIGADGLIQYDHNKNDFTGEHIEAMYYEIKNSRYVPRAILMDLEPTVIDEVRTGSYRTLWHPSNLVNHKEDAASNYGRGYYTSGKHFLVGVMDRVTKEIERCDNLSAFEILHSYAGGTGSGFSALLIEKLSELYSKKFKFTLGVFPSPRLSEIMVEAYNTILHTHCSMANEDCVVLFDNESLFNKSVDKLKVHQPTFTLMNRLISQMYSSISLSHRYRFFGSQHADVTELLTNLVPYPRIHFPIMSYSPIISFDQQQHEIFDCSRLTIDVFHPTNQVLTNNSVGSKFMSCCMLYRGCVSPKPAIDAVGKIKNSRDVNFVDWCPTGFKIGINTCRPLQIPHCAQAVGDNALCMISGNTSIRLCWNQISKKFDMLMAKRAFMHWFVMEGLEEGEFLDSREDIQSLIMDYEELTNQDGEEDKIESPTPPQQNINSNFNNKILTNLTNHPNLKKRTFLNTKYNQIYFTDNIAEGLDPELDLSQSKIDSGQFIDDYEEDEDIEIDPVSKLEKKFGQNRSAVTLSDRTKSDVVAHSNCDVKSILQKCHQAIDNVQQVVNTNQKSRKTNTRYLPIKRNISGNCKKSEKYVKDIQKTVEKYLFRPLPTSNTRRNLTFPKRPGFSKIPNLSLDKSIVNDQLTTSDSLSISERNEFIRKYELMKNNNKDISSNNSSSNLFQSFKSHSKTEVSNYKRAVENKVFINKSQKFATKSRIRSKAYENFLQNPNNKSIDLISETYDSNMFKTDTYAESMDVQMKSESTLRDYSIKMSSDLPRKYKTITFTRKNKLEICSIETVSCDPLVNY